MQELTRVREAIESYARINEQSLGRKGKGQPNDAGNAGRYVMVDKDDIQQTLSLLDKTNADELHELQSMRDSLRRTLRALGQRKRARRAVRRAGLAAFARAVSWASPRRPCVSTTTATACAARLAAR